MLSGFLPPLFAFLIKMKTTTMMMITITKTSEEITDICIIPKDSSDAEVTFMSPVDGGVSDDDPEDRKRRIIKSIFRESEVIDSCVFGYFFTKYYPRIVKEPLFLSTKKAYCMKKKPDILYFFMPLFKRYSKLGSFLTRSVFRLVNLRKRKNIYINITD